MKIAYIVLAHRYPEQVIRLVDRLHTATANFLIHVDKKTEKQVYQQLVKELAPRPNVYFIKRYTCFWGGFGIVQATFQGIQEAIERNIAFDYLALLSGQDYPIKTNAQIYQFLQQHEGKSFMHLNPFPYEVWADQQGGWDRVNYWHIIRQNNHIVFPTDTISQKSRALNLAWKQVITLLGLKKIKRKFPAGMQPYGGAQFWCLYHTHAQYVYRFIRNNRAFFRFFKYVFVPDEIFFHTIMGNSGFAHQIKPDTLHFLEWDRPGATLYQSDIDNICRSAYLFARKFDSTVDAEILDLIDTLILIPAGTSNNW